MLANYISDIGSEVNIFEMGFIASYPAGAKHSSCPARNSSNRHRARLQAFRSYPQWQLYFIGDAALGLRSY